MKTLPKINIFDGFVGWFLQRLTGLVIFVWAIMHIFTNSLLLLGKEAYEAEIAFYHSLWFVEIFYLLLGIAIYYHAINGIIAIVRDARSSANVDTKSGSSYWFSVGYQPKFERTIWLLRRITGILLVVLVTYHLIIIHVVRGYEYYSSYESVVKFGYGSLFSLVIYTLFVFSLGIHAFDGLRVIINDLFGFSSKKLVRVMFILALIYFAVGEYIAINMYLVAQTL